MFDAIPSWSWDSLKGVFRWIRYFCGMPEPPRQHMITVQETSGQGTSRSCQEQGPAAKAGPLLRRAAAGALLRYWRFASWEERAFMLRTASTWIGFRRNWPNWEFLSNRI